MTKDKCQDGGECDRETETTDSFLNACHWMPFLVRITSGHSVMCFTDLKKTTGKHEFSRKRETDKELLDCSVALKFCNWFANSNFLIALKCLECIYMLIKNLLK